MRLLHILPSLNQSYGGPVRAVLDLSARAINFGLESEVVGFGEFNIPDNPLAAECIHLLPSSRPRTYCYSCQLIPWLRANLSRFNGAVLHGMWLYPNWATASECQSAGVPYACFPHGMLESWAVYGQGPWKAVKKSVYWFLRERAIFQRASCLYFTTTRERELAERTFQLTGMRLLLAPYGVDTAQVRTSAPLRPELTQPLGRKVALFLGRLHPKKNVAFLIEAWAASRPPEPWHLVIAGSGGESYTRYLQHLILSAGLQDRVHMVGFVSGADKSYLLQRASWFLLPSQQENFGIAVVEALASGCPVVISDQVFLSESMHARSEVLPLNPIAWQKFMQQRMPDDDWRRELRLLDEQLLIPKLDISVVAQNWAYTLTSTFAAQVNQR